MTLFTCVSLNCDYLMARLKHDILMKYDIETVPSNTELKTLERVDMVSPKVLKEVAQPIAILSESNDFGQPLFKSLVPFSVHAAAGNYVSRKEHLVKTTIIDKLEHLNAELQE